MSHFRRGETRNPTKLFLTASAWRCHCVSSHSPTRTLLLSPGPRSNGRGMVGTGMATVSRGRMYSSSLVDQSDHCNRPDSCCIPGRYLQTFFCSCLLTSFFQFLVFPSHQLLRLASAFLLIVIPASVQQVKMSNSEWNDAEANVLPEKIEEMEQKGEIPIPKDRKRIVVVGLGMVGIAFMLVALVF